MTLLTSSLPTPARDIDGKAISAQVLDEVREEVLLLAAQKIFPALAVVLVGDDPASHVYVRNKGKQTVECGMASFEHRLPADVGQADRGAAAQPPVFLIGYSGASTCKYAIIVPIAVVTNG